MLAIVDAQREYAASDADGNGVLRLRAAFPLLAGEKGRTLLARGRRRSAKPAGASRGGGSPRVLSQAPGGLGAAAVSRLPVPDPHVADQGRGGRRIRLHGGRQAPRRLRGRRVA